MGIDSQVSLLVAALDLKLVQLLRGAMRAADCGGDGRPGGGCGPLHPARGFEPRPRLHSTPEIGPRPRIEPTPRIEPRKVVHVAPRLETQIDIERPREARIPVTVSYKPACESPMQPPWKVLPWQTPAPPRPPVKIQVRRHDIVRNGSMIDCFI